jgi:hypothetical protein
MLIDTRHHSRFLSGPGIQPYGSNVYVEKVKAARSVELSLGVLCGQTVPTIVPVRRQKKVSRVQQVPPASFFTAGLAALAEWLKDRE